MYIQYVYIYRAISIKWFYIIKAVRKMIIKEIQWILLSAFFVYNAYKCAL